MRRPGKTDSRRCAAVVRGIVALYACSGLAWIQAGEPPGAAVPVTDPAILSAVYRQTLTQPIYAQETESSLQEHLLGWLNRLSLRLDDPASTARLNSLISLAMTFLVILAIAGLIYLAFRLFGRRSLDPREPGTRSDLEAAAPSESVEAVVAQARARADWRGAWRGTWRDFLSRLESHGLVPADRSRTNREYLVRLGETLAACPPLEGIRRLVETHDQTIYGQRPVGEADWLAFDAQVRQTLREIDSVPETGRGERR